MKKHSFPNKNLIYVIIPLSFCLLLFIYHTYIFPAPHTTSLNIVETVADTDKLRIDIIDISLKNSVLDFTILVTAKNLETVSKNIGGATFPLNNYRFGSDTQGTLFNSADKITKTYYYIESLPQLEKNQFAIEYSITSHSGFEYGNNSIILSQFGYYTISNAANNQLYSIHEIYHDTWSFNLNINPN